MTLVGLGSGCATHRGAGSHVACSECSRADQLSFREPYDQESGLTREHWLAHQPDVQWGDCGTCERVLLTYR